MADTVWSLDPRQRAHHRPLALSSSRLISRSIGVSPEYRPRHLYTVPGDMPVATEAA